MGKIKLIAKLISNEESFDIENTGIKLDNKIIYKENDINVTILIYNNRIEMNRSCNEYKINLIFEKNKFTKTTYNFVGGNKVFELETFTNKLDINDNKLEIEYELEGSPFKYLLKWEVSNEDNIKK